MTIWLPDLSTRSGPRYLAISEAISEDIQNGRLPAGARLPTHRDLAYRLGVTVGTVSRAYAEAERRGLIAGEVGRGTYVRAGSDAPLSPFSHDAAKPDVIELSMNYPMIGPRAAALQETMVWLASRNDLGALFAYDPPGGRLAHRSAGAEWIGRRGLDATTDEVVVTSGAQNGMLAALSAIAKPGDLVLTEPLVYPGMRSAAALLHVRLEGVAMDSEGILPDAFEAACRSEVPKALYCVPAIQNPTTAVMSVERRRAIAEVARRYHVAVIEDDIYGFLLETPLPPIASFVPELGFYIASASKCMAPALRIAFVRAPGDMIARLVAGISATCWMGSPVMAEIAAQWVRDGTADRVAAATRREAAARQALARDRLDGYRYDAYPSGMHLWLHLPEPWRAQAFTEHARARGVAVAPPEFFAVGRGEVPHAVRVCLGAPQARSEVEQGLDVLRQILASEPAPIDPVV